MKRYRVHFDNAPFAWVEVRGKDPVDAELEAIRMALRDFADKLPPSLDLGEATVEEVV